MMLGGLGGPGAALDAPLNRGTNVVITPSNPCSKPHSHQEPLKLVSSRVSSPPSLGPQQGLGGQWGYVL